MATISEIEELAKKVDNPSLSLIDPGIVTQVWDDGKITFQKSGKFLWQRFIHCTKPGHPFNKVKMPHEFIGNRSYAFVDLEDALKISEMIYSI